mmetsp:Transcript_6294/g.15173  ORF Transcript_6294/g.15173 Transcript_6294/m.15173 type:complete len:244 (+) Transcript_6294:462-1193(+)
MKMGAAAGMAQRVQSSLVLGPDLRRTLLGTVVLTIFFSIYKPDESPDISFNSALIGDRFFATEEFDVSCLDETDADKKIQGFNDTTVSLLCTIPPKEEGPRSFELFNTETGAQLDLILKEQLGQLVDGREALANCRGFELQNVPIGFDAGATFQNIIKDSRSIGKYLGVAAKDGTLGDDTCVGVRVKWNHSCKGIERGQNGLIVSVQVVQFLMVMAMWELRVKTSTGISRLLGLTGMGSGLLP